MIIVAGSKRSGSSMWMQVLKAAGLTVLGDPFPSNWRESIGDANPRGFFESKLVHGVYFRTNPDPRTGAYLRPADTRELAVKVFAPGLVRTDVAYLDRVIITIRPWREHTVSMKKLRELGASAHGLDESRAGKLHMSPALEWWSDYYALIRDAAIRGYPVHVQPYSTLLANPRKVLEPIFEWLGGGDVDAAAGAVDPGLHRNQEAQLMGEVHDPFLDPETIQLFDDLYQTLSDEAPLDDALIGRLNDTQSRLLPHYAEHRARVRFDVASRIAGGETPRLTLAGDRSGR